MSEREKKDIGFVSARGALKVERDPEAPGMWEASADGFGPVARGSTPIEAIEALRGILRERTGPCRFRGNRDEGGAQPDRFNAGHGECYRYRSGWHPVAQEEERP